MSTTEQPYQLSSSPSEAFRSALDIAPDKVHEQVSLQSLNSFHLDVKAARYIRVTHLESLRAVLQDERPELIVGGGSNLLLTRDIQGLLLHIDLKSQDFIPLDENHILMQAGAGENWHRMVMKSLEHGYGGIENLSLIPGSMGAAPMQNIGAYGVELKDCFHSLQALNRETLELETFDNAACAFGYRESIFKHALRNHYIITQVTLRLTRQNHKLEYSYGDIRQVLEQEGLEPSPQNISHAVIQIRRSKLPDPAVIGNAGSFFKNPELEPEAFEQLKALRPDVPAYPLPDGRSKVPAAWLIDQAGWKGHRRGSIGVHDKQALVLVNHGGGSGEDIWQLALDIQHDVLERFGVKLHPEVNVY